MNCFYTGTVNLLLKIVSVFGSFVSRDPKIRVWPHRVVALC